MSFIDHARIYIVSGKGGDGHVSFRREKYVANGGPDGGDGGDGGSIIFETDPGMHTLSSFRHRYKFAAGDGENGGKRRCHGKNGRDVILKVPEGTVITEASSGRVIADLSGDNRRVVILKGGRGGRGNMHFATSTMQAPKYAKPGGDGKELEVRLELKLLADVALVGFPNAGKSTFLSRVSNAKPRIADYPFTTLVPQLGVVDMEDGKGFLIADIPGLIEGASEGAGLGHEFLRHIERSRLLLHMVDAAGTEGRDPVSDAHIIMNELAGYGKGLAELPMIIAANKTDAVSDSDGGEDPVSRLKKEFEPEGINVFPISAATGEGIKELLYEISAILEKTPRSIRTFASEYDPEKELAGADAAYTIEKSKEEEDTFVVEGPAVERMLNNTVLDSEKGFRFFQSFVKDTGIQDGLLKAGIKEGDTVRMYGWSFTYYDE